MYNHKLPYTLRPRTDSYRTLQLGLDVPSYFFEGLKQIDDNLCLVWHEHSVLWEDIINEYSGSLLEPRYQITQNGAHLDFGFVFKQPDNSPIYDKNWHVWRLNPIAGWCHIVKLESREQEYLNLVLGRLHTQAKWTDKYGFKSYHRLLEETQQEERDQLKRDREALMMDTQAENSWLMRKARDNASRGVYQSTNPQKEQIMSYAGQTHRSRVSRPITDEEGGLILPDSYK